MYAVFIYHFFVVAFMFYEASLVFRIFFFQAEDGIRDLVRSRGLGDVYKRQLPRARCLRLPGLHRRRHVQQRDSPDQPTGCVRNGLSLIHI